MEMDKNFFRSTLPVTTACECCGTLADRTVTMRFTTGVKSMYVCALCEYTIQALDGTTHLAYNELVGAVRCHTETYRLGRVEMIDKSYREMRKKYKDPKTAMSMLMEQGQFAPHEIAWWIGLEPNKAKIVNMDDYRRATNAKA